MTDLVAAGRPPPGVSEPEKIDAKLDAAFQEFDYETAYGLVREVQEFILENGQFGRHIIYNPVGSTVSWNYLHAALKSESEGYTFESESLQALADVCAVVLSNIHDFQAMQEKNRLAALGAMAAGLAHEIRNPLGGIAGFAALLERDLDAQDPRRRLVHKITEGVGRLNRIVSSLLTYTRPLKLNNHPVDLVTLV